MEEDYAHQYAILKHLDGKLDHLEELIYAIWKNWSEIHQEKFQNAREDNTIIKLTQKTQDLCISPKSDEFCQDLQNHKWPNNLKRQLEYSTSEDELTIIIYKPINKTEQAFQIMVYGNEKINGNLFKTKPKRKEVIFSEHHELSDEEIINEIEKDFKIMEEGDKNLKKTYHINFLDRPLNSQEEPH
ncbi:hypothetical protein O181_061773 [Austropuccinia psidii MF-1]|uniref:Uncharacterized protein n=1 Tax=Austropuccinia psidii MF-1 TaxID=1389203 RepID=A0A9Q3ENH8_9BASI|nr:hypothetical protein [Austropuccinia psidii MF-1]